MTVQGYYFGAGPSMLPDDLLAQAQRDIFDWQDTGLSILELGHRTTAFSQLIETAKADLIELMSIPDDYEILFLAGPARHQFAMIPMNLATQQRSKAAYLKTGLWSQLAFEEAHRLITPYLIESEQVNPPLEETAYAFYTPNETIDGVYTHLSALDFYAQNDIPIIADMTSCILSESIDVSQFGVIIAGAQKNIAPAGLTLVIIKKALLDSTPQHPLPVIFDYRTHLKHNSLYATPPIFQCAMAAQMFRWLKANGGIAHFEALSQAKARLLYDYLDQSSRYHALIQDKNARSALNVCFTLSNEAHNEAFLVAAEQAHLLGLKGHRIKGGLRASLYNAMPIEGVETLVHFMDELSL